MWFVPTVAKISHHHETLGEALMGTELEFSGLDIKFMSNQPEKESICSVKLDERKLKAFKYAVKHHYWYQMYLDDMPMWALVGDFGNGHTDQEKGDEDMYIWTHKGFHYERLKYLPAICIERQPSCTAMQPL